MHASSRIMPLNSGNMDHLVSEKHFPNIRTGRRAFSAWPPRSPDITLLGFFF
jgi:hypothetical protein